MPDEVEQFEAGEPADITLFMRNGSTRHIRAGNHLLDLFSAARELEWIKESLTDNESEQAGGGHMLELLRVSLNGSAEEEPHHDQS